jgi:septal ring factor EnvC (AmiA/AmiB activator)
MSIWGAYKWLKMRRINRISIFVFLSKSKIYYDFNFSNQKVDSKSRLHKNEKNISKSNTKLVKSSSNSFKIQENVKHLNSTLKTTNRGIVIY